MKLVRSDDSNRRLEVLGFAIAPVAAVSVNGIERWWLRADVLGAFNPLMFILVYTFSVLFGLPLHDYLLKRGARWWAYTIGAGVVAAIPFLLFVPVFWLYALLPAVLAAPCGAAWGLTLWLIGVRHSGNTVRQQPPRA
jgi:hypothetical protein